MNNLNIAGVYRKRRITLWLAFSGLVFALPAPASEQEEELAPAPATKFSVQCGKEGSGSSNSTCRKECTCKYGAGRRLAALSRRFSARACSTCSSRPSPCSSPASPGTCKIMVPVCAQGMYCNPDHPQPNRFSRCGSSEKTAGLDEDLLLLSLPRSFLYGE